jgi:hypothetical protein
MKKIIVFALFCFGISTASYSQAGKESSSKKGKFFSRIFHPSNKPRAQMQHFDGRKKDPNMKHNGTAFRRNRKSEYKVDGDGFGIPSNGNKKRGKDTGIK